MKKTNILFYSALVVSTLLSACKKETDQQIPPDLSFKTGAGYTSANDSLSMNDTILIGVNASKTEDKDLLTRFVVTKKYDSGSPSTVLNESFNLDTYSKDMQFITRDTAGIEAYTFTIINRDGITKTLSLTFTVN